MKEEKPLPELNKEDSWGDLHSVLTELCKEDWKVYTRNQLYVISMI